jgi:hypothetical protein
MKVLRNTLIVAVLTVVAVVAVQLALSGTPEVSPAPREEAAPAVTERPAPAAEPRPAAQPSIPPMLALREEKVELPEDEGEHGEFTTATDIFKQKLFKKEPKLAQFDYFREHVLLDSATREDYRKLLADKAMLEQTRNELLHPKDTKDTTETNVKRLMQVDYLREALAWKEHPGRAQVLDMVESIILEDSFTAQMPPDVKRSLSATKMELYEIFSTHEPARALALVEKARGTRLDKMVQYFAEYNQRRIVKERELSVQALNNPSTTP